MPERDEGAAPRRPGGPGAVGHHLRDRRECLPIRDMSASPGMPKAATWRESRLTTEPGNRLSKPRMSANEETAAPLPRGGPRAPGSSSIWPDRPPRRPPPTREGASRAQGATSARHPAAQGEAARSGPPKHPTTFTACRAGSVPRRGPSIHKQQGATPSAARTGRCRRPRGGGRPAEPWVGTSGEARHRDRPRPPRAAHTSAPRRGIGKANEPAMVARGRGR